MRGRPGWVRDIESNVSVAIHLASQISTKNADVHLTFMLKPIVSRLRSTVSATFCMRSRRSDAIINEWFDGRLSEPASVRSAFPSNKSAKASGGSSPDSAVHELRLRLSILHIPGGCIQSKLFLGGELDSIDLNAGGGSLARCYWM